MRAVKQFVVFAVLGLGLIATPADAGWNQWNRFLGEWWSDGYHALGDRWSRPPQAVHAWQRPVSHGYARPIYHPPVVVPHHGHHMEEVAEPIPAKAVRSVETE